MKAAVARMADTGLTSFPVVEPGRLLGIVGLRDLLRARERQLSEERNRERWLRVRLFRGGSTSSVPEAAD